MEIEPIAYIRTDFKDKFGIPRQSGRVESLTGRVIFLPKYSNPDAFRELEGFSHLWLIFDFSGAHRNQWSATVRPPRLGGNRRVGVFASRSPYRPNPLGLSSVRLLRIERTKNEEISLVVSGVDLLDMTPIYDVKPYLPFTDSHPDALGGYAAEKQSYRLKVIFPEPLLQKLPQGDRRTVFDCLAEDPRPSYHDDPNRIYKMCFGSFEIAFRVADQELIVIDVTEKLS